MIEVNKNTIRLTKGDNLPISYNWPDYTALFTVRLTIKKDYEDIDADAIFSEVGAVSGKTISWNVKPVVTQAMEGNYVFDIQISDGADQVRTPVIGTLVITKGVRDGK